MGLVLATRQSPLALKQAQLAQLHVSAALGVDEPTLLPLKTTGDKQRDWSLEAKGGKGLFTKELERALLVGKADLAVHSAKDLPTEMDERLCIAAYLPRACVQDVLIYSDQLHAQALKHFGRSSLSPDLLIAFLQDQGEALALATGSPRRREQMRLLLPQARFTELRGNILTRLGAIARGPASATLLAAAGLERMSYLPRAGVQSLKLPFEWMVPAAGQGAIALQCRSEERSRWEALTHGPTHAAVTQERSVLHDKGGGCHTALGVHAAPDRLWLFEPS